MRKVKQAKECGHEVKVWRPSMGPPDPSGKIY
jgi:hypothetical protein